MKKLTNTLLIICAIFGIGAIIFMLPIREIKGAIYGAITLSFTALAIVLTSMCFINDNKAKAWRGVRFGLSILGIGAMVIWSIIKPISSNTIPIFILIVVGIVLILTIVFNRVAQKENS